MRSGVQSLDAADRSVRATLCGLKLIPRLLKLWGRDQGVQSLDAACTSASGPLTRGSYSWAAPNLTRILIGFRREAGEKAVDTRRARVSAYRLTWTVCRAR
jgi:hypothetical protein